MKISMRQLVLLVVVVLPSLPAAESLTTGGAVKTQTFLSPPFFLRPGSVTNKWYYNLDFPRGHVAIKSFNGEVVDELGASVPLHETYLHHWLLLPYYYSAATNETIPDPNSGPCKDSLGQYFGLGSETRRTPTWVPDPYGIEVGDAPAGYEQRWTLNVHAIDTRGAAGGDTLGCTECRCALYNVTVDEFGRRLGNGYVGGLHCCYDRTRCNVKNTTCTAAMEEEEEEEEPQRKLFFQYTVSWVDWSAAVVPVRIYILDVTDTALVDGRPKPDCLVEYHVEACTPEDRAIARTNGDECVDVRATKEMVSRGGDLVYGVAHQHRGGVGTSLRGEDGRLLCESTPIYGTGTEAGNEAGYIVGMSTCYPAPGTVKVRDGEVLTFVSNYSSERLHTGVMAHFYLLVADEQKKELQQDSKKQTSQLCINFPVALCLPTWMWSNM